MIEGNDFVFKKPFTKIMGFNQLIQGNIHQSQLSLLVLQILTSAYSKYMYIQMENWKTNKGDLLHYYIFQSSDDWRYGHNYHLTTKIKEKNCQFLGMITD